jgi:hypothetical protein
MAKVPSLQTNPIYTNSERRSLSVRLVTRRRALLLYDCEEQAMAKAALGLLWPVLQTVRRVHSRQPT